MYTYRKRIAAFALAALMGLACIGCGKSDESSQPTVTQAETTAEVTTAAVTTTKPAAATTTTADTTTETTTPQTTTTAATTTAAVQAETAPPQAPTAPTVQPNAKPPQNIVTSGSLDSIVKSYPRNTSVILYCMDGKTLYSNDPNHIYYGASMIKLPYIYYCCTQLEKGIHSLDETVTYTDANYFPGTGVIINGGVGKKYTVEQLIDYTLSYSDNVAYIMLIHMFGIDGFNKMTKEWGYGNIQLYSYSYFVDVTPSFILAAMQKMQKKSTSSRIWQAAWKGLLGSEGLYIKQCFPNEAVAGKYGYKSGVYHEVCFFGGNEPYILIVMSEINGIEQCGSYLASVASAARAEVNKYTAQKQAAKTTTTTTTTTTNTTTAAQTSPTEETTPELAPETTPPEESTPQETTPEITETDETIENTYESER